MKRRPSTAAATSAARSGWFARWFGLPPGQQTRGRPASAGSRHIPYTPEAYPQLSQEACDILNTPLEQLDPGIVAMLFAGLAQHIADNMAPDSGLTDPKVIFQTLWSRLGDARGQATPDAAAAGQPDEAPADAADAVPDAPPDAPDEAEAEAPGLPHDAGISGIAVSDRSPGRMVAPRPGGHRSRSHFRGRRQFLRRRGAASNRDLRNRQQRRPPPRRLFYAACAGPP